MSSPFSNNHLMSKRQQTSRSIKKYWHYPTVNSLISEIIIPPTVNSLISYLIRWLHITSIQQLYDKRPHLLIYRYKEVNISRKNPRTVGHKSKMLVARFTFSWLLVVFHILYGEMTKFSGFFPSFFQRAFPRGRRSVK